MKLTNASIKVLTYDKTENKADLRFDDELRGFGLRVYPSGRKSFFVSYRNTSGTKKRVMLGVRRIHRDPGPTPSTGQAG